MQQGVRDSYHIPRELIRAIKNATKIAVLTGAGISAESGVPTFREAQTGLWAKYDPQELATPQAFLRNPELVWKWYSWRRELVSKAQPNSGHYALAELEKYVPELILITQNIDGLHSRAGSKNIIELHGNIQRTKCFDDGQVVDKWREPADIPPRCPRCNGLLRPDVVWFGENLPYSVLAVAIQAARTCDIFISIGTSAVVQPAASLPLEAVQNQAIAIEINPWPTPISRFMTYVLSGPAGFILPAIVKALKGWGIEN